ncbi:MAG: sigma-70 family RNA polymerase sigma factor [Bacteroidales bacterium]|nr:sigma-70 family RNA polymerase sigma factor [Bacteroidales bacterium]
MDLSKFSDQELISAFISGKSKYINIIIKRHQSRVLGYIIVSVKDKDIANDIFQDTFIKVVNKLKEGAYNEQGKFISWVLRIAHNLIIDHYRKTSRVHMVRSNDEYDVFNTLPVFDKNKEEEIIAQQTHAKIRDLVELLPQSQREVLKMRHYQDMNFKDIAENTNVSINTALGRMRYAIINLRKMATESGISIEN